MAVVGHSTFLMAGYIFHNLSSDVRKCPWRNGSASGFGSNPANPGFDVSWTLWVRVPSGTDFCGFYIYFFGRRSQTFLNQKKKVHMDRTRSKKDSSDVALSSILSSYLLSDPPSPQYALPSILSFIASNKPFSTSQASHKWNTRISSLIQSKSAESRFWGVCLAKATIVSGGEGTAHAVTWTKLLLTLLNVLP